MQMYLFHIFYVGIKYTYKCTILYKVVGTLDNIPSYIFTC